MAIPLFMTVFKPLNIRQLPKRFVDYLRKGTVSKFIEPRSYLIEALIEDTVIGEEPKYQ